MGVARGMLPDIYGYLCRNMVKCEFKMKGVTLIYVDGCYEIWYAKEEDEFVLLTPNKEGIPFPNLMSARQELIRLQTEGIAQGRLPKSLVKGGCR